MIGIYKFNMFNSNERDQSEFNMGISYLQRLNSLFYYCDYASMNLDAFRWFHTLMTLYRELSTEMKEEEIIEWDNKIKNISILINIHLKNNQKTISSLIDPNLYNELHQFELFIRNVLKDAGLQNKMKEDPGSALDGG